MINRCIATFVRAKQLVARTTMYFDEVEGRAPMLKGGKIRLLEEDGRCLLC